MALRDNLAMHGLRRRVGLLYDERMCKHSTPDGIDHPECPDRVRAIWKTLHKSGILQRCILLSVKPVDDKYLLPIHSKKHIDLIKNISSKSFDDHRYFISMQFDSIYLNHGSSEAAYLAAGAVVEAAERVANGELHSAFAIVRPPGHHAEQNEPKGFCLFNNVAIAANYLLNEKPELGIKKILIVDWDVHHGNGTQRAFWEDSRVLFFSVHMHESGTFYPGTDEGSDIMTGSGDGSGHNINIPWDESGRGDADYLAVWDCLLIPVAKEFNPDMIILSAGFDAAAGDPLGGCCVTPEGYSLMLRKLMEFGNGRIVMALEGGYNLKSTASCALACVQVLLKPVESSAAIPVHSHPSASARRVIRSVRSRLSAFWPVLNEERDDAAASSLLKPLSDMKLSVAEREKSWRDRLTGVDIWYAAYGSNMCQQRFLCYIEGGKMEGMRERCAGSVDKRRWKDIKWKTFRRWRMFFARESTKTWGPGGVAYLLHGPSDHDEVHMCLYRITMEQFNDVLMHENGMGCCGDVASPPLDSTHLDSLYQRGSLSGAGLEGGWYPDILYLGKEGGIPILSLTCCSAFEKCKGAHEPCKEYKNVLVRGLVEGSRLSFDEAHAYVNAACSEPLSICIVEETELNGLDPPPGKPL